jgi:hypothetical protein
VKRHKPTWRQETRRFVSRGIASLQSSCAATNAPAALPQLEQLERTATRQQACGGVSSFLGTVDLTTGFVTPFAIGFGKRTGLVWSTGP